MVVILVQQYNTGEKPSVMLYTYINHHAETPDKNRNKTIVVQILVFVIILSSTLKQKGLIYMVKRITFTFYNQSVRIFLRVYILVVS